MARILVIDDEYLVRFTLARILRREGHQVATAADGERGIAAFHTLAPDLVIADLVMAETRGCCAIEAVRRADPATRIIAITHRCDADDAEAIAIAHRMGANDVITRPFDAGDLLHHLEAALGERTDAS